MKYFDAPDLRSRMLEIVKLCGFDWVDVSRVECIRSKGSKTKRTLARCHALGKVMQHGMGVGAFYTIEFLEPFEELSRKEQDKVIIHELLHIPKTFGGGFRHHDFVCDKNIDKMYQKFESAKSETQGWKYNG